MTIINGVLIILLDLKIKSMIIIILLAAHSKLSYKLSYNILYYIICDINFSQTDIKLAFLEASDSALYMATARLKPVDIGTVSAQLTVLLFYLFNIIILSKYLIFWMGLQSEQHKLYKFSLILIDL